MDLSGLRESLHRLALLDGGGANTNNKDPPDNNHNDGVVSLCKAGLGGALRDDGSPHGTPPQQQNTEVPDQQKEPESNRTNGDGTATKGGEEKIFGKNVAVKRRRRPRPDPMVALLRAGEGGGIRVYDNEGDEWDLSSSDSGTSKSLGHRKSMSQRSPLMRMRVLINGVTALLCVSMGSNVNILKPQIAKRARLSVRKMEPPVHVSLDTGNGCGTRMQVDWQALSAPYQIDDFFAQDDFLVTPAMTTSYVDGIVGIDWLEKHKPTVNYRLNRIELIDLRGRVHIIESVPGSERAGRGENETQWITARMWDWDLKTILHGQQYQSDDVYSLEAID
ncbi:unnamed protein product [Calypogeia fissa]